MTITGGSKLSDEEIDRMVKDAEAHAADDKKAKEEADVRNQAEQAVYSVQSLIKDNKDKLSDATVTEVQAAADKVTEALKGSDIEAVKSALTELNESSQKLGQEIYQQAQAAQADAGQAGAAASESSDDDVVDAEVVDDEEGNK